MGLLVTLAFKLQSRDTAGRNGRTGEGHDIFDSRVSVNV